MVAPRAHLQRQGNVEPVLVSVPGISFCLGNFQRLGVSYRVSQLDPRLDGL